MQCVQILSSIDVVQLTFLVLLLLSSLARTQSGAHDIHINKESYGRFKGKNLKDADMWDCSMREHSDEVVDLKKFSSIRKCNERISCILEKDGKVLYLVKRYEYYGQSVPETVVKVESKKGEIREVVLNSEGEHVFTKEEYLSSNYTGELYRTSQKNGNTEIALITDLLERKDWSELEQKRVHGEKVIQDKLPSGDSTFGYYYLPKDYSSEKKAPLMVLFKGGNEPFLSHTNEAEHKEEIDFYRKKGYVVLLANYRGKGRINRTLAKEAPYHPDSTQDVVSLIERLRAVVNIDVQNINTSGCSMGGYMSALFAAKVGELAPEYRVRKSLVNSGILNTVDGFFDYNYTLKRVDNRRDATGLDHVLEGSLGFMGRVKGVSDELWELVHNSNLSRFEETRRMQDSCDLYKKVQFKESTEHYAQSNPEADISKIQGKFLLMRGNEEFGYNGEESLTQFQEKLGKERVQVIHHKKGHCADTDFVLKHAENFF